MQTRTSIIHNEIDSFQSRGTIDARINGEISIDDGRIKPAARDAYYRIKAHLSGLKERLSMLISQQNDELVGLDSEIDTTKEKLNSINTASRFKIFLHIHYLGGLLYLEISCFQGVDSKRLGLGGSGIQIDRTMGLSYSYRIAPFCKICNRQVLGTNLENGSKNMKKLIAGIYISGWW